MAYVWNIFIWCLKKTSTLVFLWWQKYFGKFWSISFRQFHQAYTSYSWRVFISMPFFICFLFKIVLFISSLFSWIFFSLFADPVALGFTAHHNIIQLRKNYTCKSLSESIKTISLETYFFSLHMGPIMYLIYTMQLFGW